MTDILFLAASPRDMNRVDLGREVQAIKTSLEGAHYGRSLSLEQEWAVEAGELQKYLLKHGPRIVHFSGHGTGAGEIILEDQSGAGKPLSQPALRGLFAILKDNISCVVLNACFSAHQAEAIVGEIDCVIGMSGEIKDSAAISFAAALYQGLAYGRSVKTAFDLARNHLALQGLPDQDLPVLICRPGVDPAKVFLPPKKNESPHPLVRNEASLLENAQNAGPSGSMARLEPRGSRLEIFISYSHADKEWLRRLHAYLKPLAEADGISIWDDTEILPSSVWRNEIEQAIRRATVAVLLVTQEFLASEEIRKYEFEPLLQAAESSGLPLLWIAVSPCTYKQTPLSKYQAANEPENPLASLGAAARKGQLVGISEKIIAAVRSRRPNSS